MLGIKQGIIARICTPTKSMPVLTQLIPTIHKLNKLALKKIFDRVNLIEAEYRELEEGIDQQSRKVNLTNIEKKELLYIIKCLEKDELGDFNKLKEGIKKHGLDYKLMYKDGL